MITFEQFKKLIETIQKSDDNIDKISDFIESFCDSYVIIQNTIGNGIVEFLDNYYGGDWISWWLYEDVKKSITEKDANDNEVEIDLSTLEDLYNFLTKEKQKHGN